MHASVLTEGVCEITLEAEEPEALAAFYEAVFGLERLSEEGDRIWLACGERCRLGIWRPGEKEFGDRGGRHVHFALSVRPGTLDSLSARLAAHGAGAEGPVAHDGGDRSLYLRKVRGPVPRPARGRPRRRARRPCRSGTCRSRARFRVSTRSRSPSALHTAGGDRGTLSPLSSG